MADYFEIDFHDVETAKSGDAIALRYEVNGVTRVHVVDGGYLDTGETVLETVRTHYGTPDRIDAVIVTHSDGDHAAGLRAVLEGYEVGGLWMLRPWLYAEELLSRFETYNSVDRLRSRLRAVYPHLVELETIADRRGIPIYDPFQGAAIGEFHVLAPSRTRYLDLVVRSEKTPEGTEPEPQGIVEAVGTVMRKIANLVRAAWGAETFPPEGTSAENEMSVVQYANLCGLRILLTGDAGREALREAIDYAPMKGLKLPGLDRIQVPHHGSRRNVDTDILDALLGPKLASQPVEGAESFTAIVSSAKADEDHPRKSVVRAFMHRGAKVITTENGTIATWHNAPIRPGWTGVPGLPYPNEEEA
ncbi:ComEC/Rec2 family competence protein [Novosphingobium humi]|uniref:MBL fold metallo-hydrolase n=1 Tax=Novosphingobium humi TaxID=2282397 RepID=A0ABY7U012_9SPHN|nr:MBL fold metallo-hydrolase [Novosphingobium humi]WCT78651.1 MBL fold metallo-hydrolase [Novosphingobium humi]